ncbi:MAG: DMT family transporter [Anaerolineae bacterium]
MSLLILTVLVAILGGIIVSIQAPLVGILNQRLSTLESVFITYFGGGMLALVLLLANGGGNWANWRSIPWYGLLAGPLGLVIIGALSYTTPRLGVAATMATFMAAQLIAAAWVDHFGYLGVAVRPLDLSRVIGMMVLFVGAWLIVR